MKPESRKNTCGPDAARTLLELEKTTQSLARPPSMKTLQVWQVNSVKIDGCFSLEASCLAFTLHTQTRERKTIKACSRAVML